MRKLTESETVAIAEHWHKSAATRAEFGTIERYRGFCAAALIGRLRGVNGAAALPPALRPASKV